jgi:20S proteasome subunit alpha 6
MFRNQYDSEVILYSPEGRLLQNEYATNASKNGNLLFSIKSNSHIILVSLNENIEYMAKNTNKIFSINESISVGISGIIGDGRLVYDLIQKYVKEYEIGNNLTIPISSLAVLSSKLFHTNTLYSGTRPFGINIIITGYDKNGSNLFEIHQEGFFEINIGTAIGKESDTHKKFINQIGLNFKISSVDELVYYSLKFIFEGKHQNKNGLVIQKQFNISLLGKKLKFTFINSKASKFIYKNYLSLIKKSIINTNFLF